ncbi:nucleoside triphosphate pyrophosphohydrolase [bacterium]|nr:nucleoside triphosphate pyrophosphohydrolase [bacterium]
MPTFPEAEFHKLWQTLERLLAPDGCPWDRKQKAADLARFMVEEGQEWREAVDEGDPAHQAEELGDLAFLMMFGLQRLAADEGIEPSEAPRLADEKLRRRHPDLFGEAERAGSLEAQTRRWEAIKREERGDEDGGLLKRLPRSMGALAKAHRYQDKAASVGFDWPQLSGVLDKMEEELGELREELVPLADLPTPPGEGSPSTRFRRKLDDPSLARVRDEIGDLFFVLANLCRWLDMDAEDVAEDANTKFLRRFSGMESRLKESGAALEESSLEEMEAQWQGFKAESE